MSASSPAVYDVDEQSFEREVLLRSEQVAVVVDFWAPWCGPCRSLGPVLERLVAEDFAGEVVLAKLNVDASQRLALEYGIRGIPRVLAFRKRRVVADFTGALPEAEVRRFLQALTPSASDRLAQDARAREAAGDRAGAEAAYREAIEKDRLHGPALLALGRLREAGGDAAVALDLYRRVPGGTDEAVEAARLAAALSLRAEAGTEDEAKLLSRIERDARDIEARYRLGLLLAARGAHREALEHLLEVVRLDRKYEDDAGRKAMLQVFEVTGSRSELAEEFRSRLANLLY